MVRFMEILSLMVCVPSEFTLDGTMQSESLIISEHIKIVDKFNMHDLHSGCTQSEPETYPAHNLHTSRTQSAHIPHTNRPRSRPHL
jgi:hypothetical protein